jgi:hypothetical protein
MTGCGLLRGRQLMYRREQQLSATASAVLLRSVVGEQFSFEESHDNPTFVDAREDAYPIMPC